jgi:hypothetical protein
MLLCFLSSKERMRLSYLNQTDCIERNFFSLSKNIKEDLDIINIKHSQIHSRYME